MDTIQDIKLKLIKHKPYLFKKYPIQSMAIFGSFSRNEQTVDSDIDIVVEFNGKIGIRFIDLADELERLIGIKVDLVSKNGIRDKYFQQIQPDLTYV